MTTHEAVARAVALLEGRESRPGLEEQLFAPLRAAVTLQAQWDPATRERNEMV